MDATLLSGPPLQRDGSRPPSAAPRPAAAAFGSIRETALEFGVSIRTLRFYEDRGLLRPRRDGAVRLYGARDRRDLKAILKGKRLGFTLAEIHAMLRSRGDPLAGIDAQEGGGDRFDTDFGELGLALPPEQIAAQIGYLERQRNDLDAAIIALPDAHRRVLETPRQAAAG